jgi:hypothetical protein
MTQSNLHLGPDGGHRFGPSSCRDGDDVVGESRSSDWTAAQSDGDRGHRLTPHRRRRGYVVAGNLMTPEPLALGALLAAISIFAAVTVS